MTPQLQQAIRLLALSNLEVESFIAEEIEKNPLLESAARRGRRARRRPEPDGDGGEAGDAPPARGRRAAAARRRSTSIQDSEDFHQDSAADSMHGLGMEGIGARRHRRTGPISTASPATRSRSTTISAARPGRCCRAPTSSIAERIVDQIDETGYFLASLLEVAQKLGVPLHEAERVLAVVQTFDPAGIAARNLAECLALQAKDADRYDPAMARLIGNLDYLAKGNLAALKRICGVDDEDMADMIRELRAYDPKPGCRFMGGERVDAIVPDVFVTRRAAGWGGRAQQRDAAAGCWSTALIITSSPAGRRTAPRKPGSTNACRAPTG